MRNLRDQGPECEKHDHFPWFGPGGECIHCFFWCIHCFFWCIFWFSIVYETVATVPDTSRSYRYVSVLLGGGQFARMEKMSAGNDIRNARWHFLFPEFFCVFTQILFISRNNTIKAASTLKICVRVETGRATVPWKAQRDRNIASKNIPYSRFLLYFSAFNHK